MSNRRVLPALSLTTVVAAAAMALLLQPARAVADLKDTIAFDIEAQQLPSALHQYSEQAGVQVTSPGDLIEGKTSRGVSGTLDARTALELLLKDTQLRYEVIDEKTVAIGPAERTPVSAIYGEGAAAEMRLVQGNDANDPAAPNAGNEKTETQGVNQPQASSTQSADPMGNKIQEIVVTAQKRVERLQDVPISMSVLSGDELDRSTVTSVTDALRAVPGVSITDSFLGGGAQVTVRGVAPAGPIFSGASTTGYYLDGIPFGFVRQAIGPDPSAYDLERVEVMRGPQGTLYGVNALNGVVRVLTKDANPSAFELKARTSASATKGGGEGYRGDLAVNVPIIEGKLAARAVVGYQDVAGWIDKPNKEDANDAQHRNLRLKINAQPTERLSIALSAWLSRSDYGASPNANDEGLNPSLLDESMESDYDVYGLQIGHEFGRFSVTSTTSYLEFSNHSFLDLAPQVGLLFETELRPKKFAQELLFKSTHEGVWQWSAGAIYNDVDDGYEQNLILFPAPESITYSSTSYAVFGELTRLFMDGQLELTAGLRYFEDDSAMQENSRFAGTPPENLVGADDTQFDATTPRFALTWHPSERMTLYASYSEGFRSGQYQSPPVRLAAPGIPAAEPDRLTNYEVGAKGSFWGGRLNLDSALYYVDWQDVQQRLTVLHGGTGYVAFVNSEAASGLGFDFGLMIQPVDRLELGLSFNWNDLRLDADLTSGGVLMASEGDRLVSSPEYTVGASADYVLPFGRNGLEARFSASAYATGEQVTREITGLEFSGDRMLVGRASVSIQAPAHWTFTFFADNINNETGSPVRGANPNWATRIPPRVIGAQLDYRW